MKKLLYVMLVASLVLLAAISASAETVASGECGADGDNLTWTFDDSGTLTISGVGEMCAIDYYNGGAPWSGLSITSVIIEEGVTSISSQAFSKSKQGGDIVYMRVPSTLEKTGPNCISGYNNIELVIDGNCTSAVNYLFMAKSVVLTDNVTEVAPSAFSSFRSKSLTMGDSVEIIGNSAFASSSFDEITIGNGIKSLGSGVFAYTDIKSITIPESVTSLNTNGLFRSCDELEEVIFECPITEIGDSMFSGCSALKNLEIPSTVTRIGKNAFSSCPNLEITLPNSIVEIGDEAFSNNGITSFTFPKSVKTVGKEVFSPVITEIYYDGTAEEYMDITFGGFDERAMPSYSLYIDGKLVEDFAVPSGTEAVKKYAFHGCTSLKSVSIPSSVEVIDTCAFEFSALESVTIAEGVKTIGYRAFAACDLLKEITLPESLETVEYYAFLNETLEKITVLSKDVEFLGGEIVPAGATIVCYTGSTAYDYAIEYGNKYEIIDGDGSVTVPVKLGTPQNLSFTDGNGYFTGTCFFDAVENANKYTFKLYSGDFVILESTTNGRYIGSALSSPDSNRRGFNFRYVVNETDFDTGEYYFTVQAKSTSDGYSNSEVAVSDVFYYTSPKEKLAEPQNITWSADGDLTFDAVENAVAYALDFFVVKNGEYDNLYTTWIYPNENESSITQEMDFLDKRMIESYMEEEGLDSVDIAYSVSAMSYDLCEYLDSDVAYSETFTYKKPALVGDVDGDGEVTVLDTLVTIEAVLNGSTDSAYDISGDGVINLIDVLRILKATVK